MATLFYMLPAPQPPAGLHAQFPVRVAVAAGAANSPRAALIRDDGMAVVFSLGGGGCAFDVPLLPPRTHYVCAALGESHAVLVRDDGAAVSMGKGTFGECDVPELTNGKRFVATAVGSGFSVLLQDDGAAVGFGLNDEGQLDIPPLPPSTSYVAAAAGSSHTVLLRSDGVAVGFGCNSSGQCAVPELPTNVRYTAAAAGPQHTVLIRSDGSAISFGRSESSFLLAPAAGTRYITAAAGAKHSVLVRDDGAAVLACSALSSDTVEVPPPPVGGHYLAAAACDVYSVLVRNDGAAVVIGEQGCSHTRAPPLPAGTSYAGLKMRSWSPELNPLFPHSSRALVHSVLCTEKRRRQEGVSFVLPELLCTLVLPFVVPAAAVPAQDVVTASRAHVAPCCFAGIGSWCLSASHHASDADTLRRKTRQCSSERFGIEPDSMRICVATGLARIAAVHIEGQHGARHIGLKLMELLRSTSALAPSDPRPAPEHVALRQAHRCHLCNYDLCEACQRLGINNGIRMPG